MLVQFLDRCLPSVLCHIQHIDLTYSSLAVKCAHLVACGRCRRPGLESFLEHR